MLQKDLSIPLEDLLLALENYTKKLDQQLIDSSELHTESQKQSQDIADWAKQLTSLLKTYQNKETLLQSEFVEAINKEIVKVFQANEDNYHKRMDEGFTKNITDASTAFLEQTKQLHGDLDTLNHSVTDITGSIDETKEQITKQAVATSKQMLEAVRRDFNRQLIINLMVVVAVVSVLALGAAWLFIPSKSEIAERRSDYQYLQKARVAHNVVKVTGQDGHYARIDPNECFEDEKSSFYSKSKLCKFK